MSRKGRSGDNAAAEGFFGILKSEFYYPRDWTGVTSEEFVAALDQWMREYSSKRLKAFREEGKVVYDTIDGRRRRLGHSS
jgi:transposase InsO family protein